MDEPQQRIFIFVWRYLYVISLCYFQMSEKKNKKYVDIRNLLFWANQSFAACLQTFRIRSDVPWKHFLSKFPGPLLILGEWRQDNLVQRNYNLYVKESKGYQNMNFSVWERSLFNIKFLLKYFFQKIVRFLYKIIDSGDQNVVKRE